MGTSTEDGRPANLATPTSRRGWRLPPALVLFFLSPMIAELLSGSSPPAEFFRPVALILMAALYGSGAILCRELTVRWGKGWPSLLTLGAAYGIVEEGLMVKSFFDPNWVDLGPLGVYGRWAGVNWVWAAELTVFHAVFSIAIPVLLVTLLVPARASEPWVRPRTLVWLGLLLAVVVAIGYFWLTPYRPPSWPYFLSAIAIVALVFVARRLPATSAVRPEADEGTRDRWFVLIAFVATAAFFLMGWILPATRIHPLATVSAEAMLVGATFWLLRRMSSGTGWRAGRRLALAAGALSFLILLAPLQQMDDKRPDNTSGMALVGLAAAGFIFWLSRRLRRPLKGIPAET